MSTNEIQTICQQLFDAGKTPSVALVKAKLTTPVPLPEVISAVKAFKSGMPEVAPIPPAPTADARITKLEHLVQQQRVEMRLLQEQVSALRFELSRVRDTQ